MFEDEARLREKLHKLEEILEQQRWSKKELQLKCEKKIGSLEKELEEERFAASYGKEQINHYQLVLNNLPEGIYTLDSHGNITAVNRKANELLPESKVLSILLEASSGRVFAETVPVVDEEEGVTRKVHVQANPLKDDEGMIVGSVAIVRNIEAAVRL